MTIWYRLAAWILRFRFPLLVLILLATAFMANKGKDVSINYEFNSAVPSTNAKVKEFQDFKSIFGEDGSMMVIGVQTPDFYEPAFFEAYRQMVDSMKTVEYVEAIISIPGAINLVKDTINNTLEAEPVYKAGMAPQAFKAAFENLPLYKGLLYNPSTQTYLMMLNINKDLLNSKNRTVTIGQIKAIGEAFGQAQQVDVKYSGLPLIRTETAALVQSEMSMFLMASLVLTTIILFLFFRSFTAIFVSLILVLIGVAWAMGTMGILGYKINLLNALIPPLIVIIGIPNAIYFLNNYHSEYKQTGDKLESIKQMLGRMGIITLFTNLTTAIGFIVFWFTDSRLLADFGLVAGLNVMVLFLMSVLLLPILFSFLPPPNPKHTDYLESKWLNRVLDKLSFWVFNKRKGIYLASFLFTLICGAGLLKLQSVGRMVDDLPQSAKIYQDLKFFEKHFKGVLPLEVMIDAKRKNGVISLSTMEKIDAFSEFADGFDEMGRTLSFVKGVKFARQAFYDGDSTSYGIPNTFDGAFIQPYLRNKKSANGAEGLDTEDTSIAKSGNVMTQLMNSFVDEDRQRARISISMADVGTVKLPLLIDTLRQKAEEIFDTSKFDLTFTGSSVVFLEGSSYIIDSLKDSVIYAFVMIFTCILLLFRNGRILLASLIVNIIPMIVTAGLMGWQHIPIKPSTVLVFSITLGIAVDVTIRFLVSYRQNVKLYPEDTLPELVQRTIKETGISIIYTSLILIAGFGVFYMSKFDGTKSLGYLTSITLLQSMIANLTILPALLYWLENRKAKRQAAKQR